MNYVNYQSNNATNMKKIKQCSALFALMVLTLACNEEDYLDTEDYDFGYTGLQFSINSHTEELSIDNFNSLFVGKGWEVLSRALILYDGSLKTDGIGDGCPTFSVLYFDNNNIMHHISPNGNYWSSRYDYDGISVHRYPLDESQIAFSGDPFLTFLKVKPDRITCVEHLGYGHLPGVEGNNTPTFSLTVLKKVSDSELKDYFGKCRDYENSPKWPIISPSNKAPLPNPD